MSTPKDTYTDAEIAGMLASGQIKPTEVQPMSGPDFVIDPENPHLGGNIKGGDSWTFDPMLWEFLIAHFGVKSVLDIGCGEGHALEWFKKRGNAVVGIEGLDANVWATRAKGIQCHSNDYLKGACPLAEHDMHYFDLVWCCEVLEHIPEGKPLDNLITDLTRGSVIAVTHAFPDQPGHHHVNCQPSEYWINAIQEKGYTYLPVATEAARALAQSPHFKRSGLIFHRL